MGHPSLMTAAQRIADPTAPEVAELIQDMKDTMRAAGGIGIAAPQIGVGLRAVLLYLPPNTDADDSTNANLRAEITSRPLTILINPEIEFLTDQRIYGYEGCLSVPGLRGMVPRIAKIKYRAQDLTGAWTETIAEGFHAVVVQHECDHLDGILYPQRIEDMSSFQFVGANEGGTYSPTGNPSAPLGKEQIKAVS